MVGMITNHSYLDNPTFRGMRQSLMKTFNEIYILNLHGNSLKKEIAPDGSKDENVFDIQQGVAIVIFMKQPNSTESVVKYVDIFGTRDSKYSELDTHQLFDSNLISINPQSPNYFFIPFDTFGINQYESWPTLISIFPVNNVGIVTSRDDFVIDFSLTSLKNRIMQFYENKISNEILSNAYKLVNTSTWSIEKARSKIQRETNLDKFYKKILYRPFDERFIFYHDEMVERTRKDVMHHMIDGDNLGLISVRRVPSSKEPKYFFLSKNMISNGSIRSDNQSIDTFFPLYLYPDIDKPDFFFPPGSEKHPNIAPGIIEGLKTAFGSRPSPEEIFYYIYSIFFSPAYRSTYAEYLRIDFPRVPFTSSAEIFQQMAAYGQRLANLHLLESPELDPPVCRYQGSGANDVVEKVIYEPASGRISINNDKYFEGISPDMWNYQIGGYQVLMKYLKDRKGRVMDDPRRYTHIATAIQRTIEIQAELDPLFHQIEKDYLKINLD